MLGINEIMEKLVNGIPLTEQERFKVINSESIKPELLVYLANRFENLTIEICGEYEGNILDLMNGSLLEGWCWETTATSIVFLNDYDYIERGNLKFEENKYYYHSWICFKYENEEYVFDPCLNLLCKKELYNRIFEVRVKSVVFAKEVRDDLIYKISNHQPRKPSCWDKYLSEEFIKQLEQEVKVDSSENVYSPMYRNNTGYRATIEEGKIKKLVAHYYKIG